MLRIIGSFWAKATDRRYCKIGKRGLGELLTSSVR
jgi:hypothetical protein